MHSAQGIEKINKYDIVKSVDKIGKADKNMKLDNNAHSVLLLHYHLVLVVKYRREVFDNDISNHAKEI